MQVTKLSLQKSKKAYNIFIDGKYAFSLSEEDVVKEHIKAGLELSLDRFEDLKFKGKKALWLSKALDFLSYRPRSEKEVLTKLKEIAYKEKDLSQITKDQLIKEVHQKLLDLKFLDDEEFGLWFVGQRRNSRIPSGDMKIKSELIQKGLKKELISRLISSEQDTTQIKGHTYSKDELVMKAALAKVKNLKDPDPIRFKRRLIAFLLRKGFEWDAVLRVVDTLVKRQYNKAELDRN